MFASDVVDMKKKKAVTSKKIKGSSSKTPVAKASKKVSKKSRIVVTRPTLPKGLKYKIKQIPSHPLRFQAVYSPTISSDIQSSLGEERTRLFRQTIFGPYLDIKQCNLQGQIFKCLLLLELDQPNREELHVRHIMGNVLRFSIKEFALITGLRCTGNEDDFKYPDDQPSKLMEKYFPGARTGVHKVRFIARFVMGQWDTDEDAVQMAIIYFLHNFVFSQPLDTTIQIHDFRLVEDGSYKLYPWGKLAFEKLITSLRQEFTIAKKMYRLTGMPYAVNAWMYECASKINADIAVKQGESIPRILNWTVVGIKPKFGSFMSTMFSAHKCTNLVPTKEELDALNLPFVEDASATDSPPNLTRITLSSKHAQPQTEELLGFEDFTSAPPDHLLRQSKRASGTSSPPPPKKRKNDKPKKQTVRDAPAQDKHVHSPQLLKKLTPSSIPDEVHPEEPLASPSNVQPHCDVRSEKMDKQTFKKLKKFMKRYFKKKFSRLEAKIDSNHLELMKSIGKKVIPLSKNMDQAATPVNVQGDGHLKSTSVVESDSPDRILEQPEVDHGSKLSDKENVSEDVEVNGSDVPSPITGSINEDVPVQEDFNNKFTEHLNVHDSKQRKDTNHNNLDDSIPAEVIQVQFDTDSAKSTSSSSDTEADIAKLISCLGGPVDVIPLMVVSQHGIIETVEGPSDSDFQSETTGKEIVLHHDTNTSTPATRIRIPSKIFQSPYVTNFGSSEQGKEKPKSSIRPYSPFEGYGICYQPPSDLMDKFRIWISRGLLPTHAKKKPKEEHYRKNSSSLGTDFMDFVVASAETKNWFYNMYQPNRCWNDQHIDVVLYYLRKKAKLRMNNQYRYTTTNCIFKVHINHAYDRYYNSPSNVDISTQEDMAIVDALSKRVRSLTGTIKGYGISAGLPWHEVDEVYIPVNSDGEFHWVLAVVVLKRRLILVYDSSLGTRKKELMGEIKKLSIMLPVYLEDSLFYEENGRIDWSSLDAYKDKESGSFLGPEHPFDVEYVQRIAQQAPDSLDCGLYVAIFAEYLSDGIPIPPAGLDANLIRTRYAALLWKYGSEKATGGYVSDTDDPPRPRGKFEEPNADDVVNIE